MTTPDPITTPVDEALDGGPYRDISPQLSRMVAYRNALDEAFHDYLQSVGKDVQPGALDGVQVITNKDMQLALRLTPLPPPSAHAADVETPATITVYGVCPNCGEGSYLSTALSVELRVGTTRELRLVSSSSKASHSCGQRAFRVVTEEAADGQQTMEDVLEGRAVRVDPETGEVLEDERDEDEEVDEDEEGDEPADHPEDE